MSEARVIFFDLGQTLGEPVLSPSDRLVGFDIYDFVPDLLDALRAEGHRLGIISNTGDEVGSTVDALLGAAGVLGAFEDGLRLYSGDVGLRKDSPAIFSLAASRAGLAEHPEACLYVGEDAAERAFAEAAGLRTCANARLVRGVVAGGPAND